MRALSKPELTKQLLAGTLKSIMRVKPLDRISVQDIVAGCGLNRKTFYYHFRDKQELICWIFDKEYASIEDLNNDNSIIDELLDHLYKNKEFYMGAITSEVQNNLREHFYAIVYDAIIQSIRKNPGSALMSSEEMRMTASYFTNAVTSTVTQWAREGMKTSPHEYSKVLHPMTNDCLKFVIDKYSRR